jgi:hypothetical protein
MQGNPKVKGYCHCEDCRELLNIPYHSVNAWDHDKVTIVEGQELIHEYQHPTLKMKKFFCKSCGDVIFNSNGMDWRVFSQLLIAKSYDNKLPEELKSKSHFYYDRRIIDVNDDLPKKE